MSGDLISRGKAIENLHKIPKIWNGNECLVSFQTVIDYMNSQMIAYDMDKVVEQLEDLKRRYWFAIANTGDKKLDCAYENVGNALDRAIKIVKSGGVVNEK